MKKLFSENKSNVWFWLFVGLAAVLLIAMPLMSLDAGNSGDEDKFHAAVSNLQSKGCNVIILACTELSVYKKHHKVPMHCVDALDVLVRESIVRSGAEYEEL